MVDGGDLYKSSDGGSTWATIQPGGYSRAWKGVACSADGQKVICTATSSYPYVSINGGSSFSMITSVYGCWDCSCSADGTKMICAGAFTGYLYLSTDSGTTWAATSAPAGPYYRIVISGDGSTIYAAWYGGTIKVSYNSGSTWSDCGSYLNYSAIDCSYDGTKVVAGSSGYMYISTNSGASWVVASYGSPFSTGWNWNAISDDGQIILGSTGAVPQTVQLSIDGGTSWVQQTDIGVGVWYPTIMTPDGSIKAVFPNDNKYVWTKDSSSAALTLGSMFIFL
jgi:photosystem II stability/assembly factor-like uncharacterized protein